MTGRPPFPKTQEIQDEICSMLADGCSLIDICNLEHMPSRATVSRWLQDDEAFEAKYVRAREDQADFMDHRILKTADECTPENAQAARVKIGAYQWRASKLAPKKYGDKVTQEVVGANGGPIKTEDVTPADAGRRVAFALAAAMALPSPAKTE